MTSFGSVQQVQVCVCVCVCARVCVCVRGGGDAYTCACVCMTGWSSICVYMNVYHRVQLLHPCSEDNCVCERMIHIYRGFLCTSHCFYFNACGQNPCSNSQCGFNDELVCLFLFSFQSARYQPAFANAKYGLAAGVCVSILQEPFGEKLLAARTYEEVA